MRFLQPLCLLLGIFTYQFSDAQNLQFRSVTTYPSEMSDVWGYAADGKEYALATYEDGFSVVDVTDPDNPVFLHDVPGPNTYWRDVKTYGHYAYGIHENTGGFLDQGLVIMDLSQLPDALSVTFWHTDGTPGVDFRDAHNIFIDEKGFVFLIGGNVASGGVLMLDVRNNPTNPTVVGEYTDRYVHDIFVRNDTLWTAEVGAGQFSIIDIRSKTNPVVLARQTTPLSFTHNIWVSDDGRTAYTTDERTGAYLAAYDITDVNDIKELDRYRSASNVIPHNAFVKDEFIVVSWYAHGIIILDGTFPDELVEVGRFDTAPNYPGQGFHGAWGVYPYLPSGNILVTDIEEGLFVLSPEYKNATHLRGTVKNETNGNEIAGAAVEIVGPEGTNNQMTTLNGTFKHGQVVGGTFTINVSKTGFESASRQITLSEGETTQFEIVLSPISYEATDTIYGEVIAGGDEIILCDENTNGVNVNIAFDCEGFTSSELGSWSVNNEGCITYSASVDAGGETDEICLVVQGTDAEDYNVNLVIIDILSSPTAVIDNAFANGSLALVNNPVHQELVINKGISTQDNYECQVYNSQGMLVSVHDLYGTMENIRIPAGHLSNGLYILSVKQGDDLKGHVKFVKQ